MKKTVMIFLTCVMLTGCAAEDTFETVAEEILQSASVPMAEIRLELPEEAAAPVAQGDGGTFYQCDGYEIALQTFASGDLDATLRSSTGHGREELTVIQTWLGKIKRYDLVWSCLGEHGDQIGRACILDDGNYHYVLSVLGEAERSGEFAEVWEELFSSYALG